MLRSSPDVLGFCVEASGFDERSTLRELCVRRRVTLVATTGPDSIAPVLSLSMQQLINTHVKRWKEHRHATRYGSLYQGRYKSFPVERKPGSLCFLLF